MVIPMRRRTAWFLNLGTPDMRWNGETETYSLVGGAEQVAQYGAASANEAAIADLQAGAGREGLQSRRSARGGGWLRLWGPEFSPKSYSFAASPSALGMPGPPRLRYRLEHLNVSGQKPPTPAAHCTSSA